ncbi:MAG: universal stress protein [Saprospiraceae bacterium]
MIKKSQIQKIVTLTNLPQHSLQAALWSDQLGATFRAQVVLYDTISPARTTEGAVGYQVNRYKVLLESSIGRLKKLAQHVKHAQNVRCLSELGVPVTNLLYQAQRENADLIVLKLPNLEETLPAGMDALLYGSKCPVFFTRSEQKPVLPQKILVPLRLQAGLEQKMPAVITWAKASNATVYLATYEPYDTNGAERKSMQELEDKLSAMLLKEDIRVVTLTMRGRHFGQTMLRCVKDTQAEMVVIVVEPSNFLNRLVKDMMGKYFLQHATVPVLAVPIMHGQARELGSAELARQQNGHSPAIGGLKYRLETPFPTA